ncbi:MAG: Spy/CpxP family protein refolding chaperone [Chitinophagaceae bacterium]
MNTITKNKWFLFLLGFLFLANIALLLSFFVFGEKGSSYKDSHSGQQGSGSLSKELLLSKEQENTFSKIKEDHFKVMKPLWAEIRKTKDSLYRQLNNPAMEDSSISAFTERIAAKNKIADELMFRHFQELRKVCTPAQQQKFDTLIPQMFNRWGNRGHAVKK